MGLSHGRTNDRGRPKAHAATQSTLRESSGDKNKDVRGTKNYLLVSRENKR